MAAPPPATSIQTGPPPPASSSARSAVTPTTPSSPTHPGPPFRSPSLSSSAPTRPLPPAPESPLSLPKTILEPSPAASTTALNGAGTDDSNPFDVDFVIPFDISAHGSDRAGAQQDAAQGYQRLINALQSEGGLRIASRPGRGGKGAEDVWVFVGASDDKVAELVDREHKSDLAHGLRAPIEEQASPATRLRLIYQLLTAPPIQQGCGVTPGEGQWKRVKAIVALHDDQRDKAWVERWTTGGDKTVGLLRGLNDADQAMLSRDQPPAVRLYFNFLTSYTLSLLPISMIGFAVWFFLPADSYSPVFAFLLSVYACVFIATWRIRERKLAVQWGTRGTETTTVDALRPQYVMAHNIQHLKREPHRRALVRDIKMVASIPMIIACGVALGFVLMCIFMLEAFASHLWHGPGASIVPFIPTALFSIVVPQVVALFNGFSSRFVAWEDHATTQTQVKSLTAKTFAMNGIVAFLGLFLTAYVYLPFGPYVMQHVQDLLSGYQGDHTHVPATHAPEGVAAAASAAAASTNLAALRSRINVSRLKSQVFAYTVTNQVVNTFLEAGLPYILRFVNDWRSGKATLKDVLKGEPEKVTGNTESDIEKRFLDKVERELALPPYNIFTDYAEMVTQFGYVVIWGLVWPLAPVFALVNNYFELRSDALKICKHVQRPVGERVESIGTWLDTLGIIAWIGAWVSATLIQLFRPRADLPKTGTLAGYLASFDSPPTVKQVLPLIAPVIFAALIASHGYFILRYVVDNIAENVLWRGSPEEEALKGSADLTGTAADDSTTGATNEKHTYSDPLAGHGFWNGPAEGAAAITTSAKTE